MYTEHLRIPVGVGALHAERTGRGGPPILLVHGFGTCAFVWRAIAPRLANAGFTAVAIDLLGHGESDRPDDASYGLAAQAEYLERALTALRMPAASVVGLDIGALVALLLAGRRPERVSRLALISPVDPRDLPGAEIRALQRMSARAALGANALFGASPLLQPLLQGAVADAAHMPALLQARYLAPFVGNDGVSRLLQLASAVDLDEDAGLLLRAVRCPTLLVEGAAVGETEGDSAATAFLRAELSQASPRLARAPDAGRLVPEDAPEWLTRALLGWIRDESGAERMEQ